MPSAQFKKRGDHIITFAKQTHNSKLITENKDFISKLEISLKECNESEYWLKLLLDTNSIAQTEFDDFQKKCVELRRMLVSSVTTLKSK